MGMMINKLMMIPLILGLGMIQNDGECQETEPRPAQTIVIPENYNHRFIAEHGDTLIILMEPEGYIAQRCDHYGGELIYNEFTDIFTCEDADF